MPSANPVAAQWGHGAWWERVQRGMQAFQDLGCAELLAG